MNKIIAAIALTLFLATFVSVSLAEDDIYQPFFGNHEKCDILAKAGFEAYKMFGENHLLVVSYSYNRQKSNEFFEEKLNVLRNLSYVKDNRSLFTERVTRHIMAAAIPIWEQYGDEYLDQKDKDYKTRYNTCMNPDKFAEKGE